MLDIYQPSEQSSAPRPAVVLIHGGGWTSFDKATMHTMGMFLARCGFVAFAVDYRLMHGNEKSRPAQLDDVQRAVRWIRANAAKYRGRLLIISERSGTPRARSWRLCWGWKKRAIIRMRPSPNTRAECRPWSKSADPQISRLIA